MQTETDAPFYQHRDLGTIRVGERLETEMLLYEVTRVTTVNVYGRVIGYRLDDGPWMEPNGELVEPLQFGSNRDFKYDPKGKNTFLYTRLFPPIWVRHE